MLSAIITFVMLLSPSHKADNAKLQLELANASNWPYQMQAPWIYQDHNSTDFQNALWLTTAYIYSKHGWVDAPVLAKWDQPRIWPDNMLPSQHPEYYVLNDGRNNPGDDEAVIYFGLMNGTYGV